MKLCFAQFQCMPWSAFLLGESAWYQIDRRHEGMSLAGKSVVV